MYAKAFFDAMEFDAVTVAPYMGEDSVKPFLTYVDKWVILLALTSNKGAFDFQFMTENNEKLFEKVIKTSAQWGSVENMMYVVGATKAEMLTDIRKLIPNHFLLVPGVGAQGGSLREVAERGMNDTCGLLVNSSRQIIYASDGEDYAEKAGQAAFEVQQEMEQLLKEKGLI
jgi:orotidine-5'-phosphate decarboxylase